MSRKRQPKPATKTAVIQTAQQGPLSQIAQQVQSGVPVAERVRQITTQQTHFEGPIPHPEIFRQYGDVIPNAPERILTVFEEDSRHVRDIQKAALEAQKEDNKRVHWMAWSLIVGGYVMSVVFAYMNKDTLASIILATTLAGTITGFLQGRKPEQPAGKK